MTIKNSFNYTWFEEGQRTRRIVERFPGSCVAGGLDIAFNNINMPEEGYRLASECYGKEGQLPRLYQGLLDIVWGGIKEWEIESVEREGDVDLLRAGRETYMTNQFEEFERLADISKRTGVILLPWFLGGHVECMLSNPDGWIWGHYLIMNQLRYTDLSSKWRQMYADEEGKRIILIFPPEPK